MNDKHVTSSKGVYKITIRASDKGIVKLNLADFASTMSSTNLKERDFSVAQFIETATSQALFGRCSTHVFLCVST